MRRILLLLTIVPGLAFSQTPPPEFDVLIRGGTIYDGTGAEPRQADVAIQGRPGRRRRGFRQGEGANRD